MGFIQISSVVPQMSNSLARITLAFSCQASLNSFESSSVSAHHSHPWHFCRALPSYFVDSPSVGFPSGANGKESACQCRRHKGHSFDPWDGKIPWRRAWQFTAVFLPGEYHGPWRATIHGVTKTWTQLKWLNMYSQLGLLKSPHD